MVTSPITAQLSEYLNEQPMAEGPINPATLLVQGQRAETWLVERYLCKWLEILGGLPDCDYPRARPVTTAVRLRQLGREGEYLKRERTRAELLFYLESLQHILRSTCSDINRPDERAMQWGLWARDVAISVACGFTETELLDTVICESVGPCCMYAAFLASMVVEDSGTVEEIEELMFEGLPRELLAALTGIPAAPEA